MSSPPSSPYCLQLKSHFTFPGKGGAGQHLCLVTKVLGGDIKALVTKHGRFPFPLAKRIILHLLRGIAHAHSRGVVHTDLKHDNIFFDTSMSSNDFDKLLASDLPRRHPPELSYEGFVTAAVSQPLPIPTLQEAMQRTFVVADFGSGNSKHVVCAASLLTYSYSAAYLHPRQERNFPVIASSSRNNDRWNVGRKGRHMGVRMLGACHSLLCTRPLLTDTHIQRSLNSSPAVLSSSIYRAQNLASMSQTSCSIR